MKFNSFTSLIKLKLLAVLSMLMAITFAQAHETNPTIADLSVEGSALTLELRLNAEAFLAGIDLSSVSDTDDAAEAADYDALQALPGSEVAELFRAGSAAFLSGVTVVADGSPVALSLSDIQVSAEAVPEVARLGLAVLSGEIPANTQAITVAWGDTYGDLVLRQQGVEAPFTGLLAGGQTSEPIQIGGGQELSGWQTFVAYIPVGFDHILPKGLDHILFVLGLFFFSLRMGPLLWQVTAFTAAHTVTLALGALGWVVVPGSIVEPIIAASIVYVGIENVRTTELTKWRPIVIFVFGLLHGLGFASVLGEFGLPAGQFIPALIGFNIGVEVGQLTVIALAFLAVGLWFGQKPWYRTMIAVPASMMISAIGIYWVIERTLL
ncbi:HupE/UreJ family protein [Cognatishimia activa]|uniref:HupE/UreJ family protein n=1 Tax=Cognatishimia activa TaxID=1715691 RepID=A0A975EPA3_9RHOB|nr:HupE/UreJ family protein [Cognatishimia activa]QTN35720.1 HupE/UreJ family protein [Cognatishimia activa]